MTDEVLKLALDALEGFIPYLPLKDEAQCNRYDKAITALRLVIDVQNMASKSTYKEQLETKDEPVAWMNRHGACKTSLFMEVEAGAKEEYTIPVYTQPQRTWVGLTDEDMNNALDYWSDNSRSSYGGAHAANGEYVDIIETWRYIEAKLKEKNHGN